VDVNLGRDKKTGKSMVRPRRASASIPLSAAFSLQRGTASAGPVRAQRVARARVQRRRRD
jgi:hypothetical protein